MPAVDPVSFSNPTSTTTPSATAALTPFEDPLDAASPSTIQLDDDDDRDGATPPSSSPPATAESITHTTLDAPSPLTSDTTLITTAPIDGTSEEKRQNELLHARLPPASDTRMRATSHVDQLYPSPPQPEFAVARAGSPPDALSALSSDIRGATPLLAALAQEQHAPILHHATLQLEPEVEPEPEPSANASATGLPPFSEPKTVSVTTPIGSSKPHPADLVGLSNPDPHRSNPSTPALERTNLFENPLSRATTQTSSVIEVEDVVGQSEESGDIRTANNSSEVPSENGAALGHGESEDGRGTRRSSVSSVQATPRIPAPEAINGIAKPRGDSDELEDSAVKEVGKSATATASSELSDSTVAKVSPAKEMRSTTPPPTTSMLVMESKTTGLSGSNGPSTRRSASGPATATTPSRSGSRAPLDAIVVTAGTVASATTTPTRANGTTSIRDATAEQREAKRQERREREKEAQREREAAGASSSSRSRRVLGDYTMSKTLGAGSMGKVKLGVSSVTGEKVAIKIIPRFTSTAAAHRPPPPESSSGKPVEPFKPPTASFLAKAAVKDQSKEVRTMREGSLCLLLHHPYICGMKNMMLYPNHYYFVTEYVNGGQMLDYIISHGRLRERSARKFARQIGSALEYCHANSIVHRDLKIENILISKTGNIKIIDFGLSNLYSPTSHLSTFCGSLYFAAPELLNAKPYTGPEVDVWSFGIVLYVLVCGKVPFDDQSMPALHAKIKRGQVEYPSWLSAECKHLLSRMLVTNPTARATLTEVLSHPWTVKGFTGPPSSHLPHRTPLRVEDIDHEIVKGMVGFEFGTDHDIHDSLCQVLTSESYRAAVRAWELKRARTNGPNGDSPETERPATRVDGKDMKGLGRSPTNKRFSGIGFYGKKLAGGINAAFTSGGPSSGSKGQDDLGHSGEDGSAGHGGSSINGSGIKLDVDPTRGFHPLISIYHLVKEKLERERIWGPGVFASSTLSLTGPPPPPAPAVAYQAGSGPVPPSPAAAGNPTMLPAAPPTASPHMPMTPQPRQRATGEEYSAHPSTAPQNIRATDYGAPPSADYVNKRASYHPSSAPATGFPMAAGYGGRPQTTYEPTSPTLARKAFAPGINATSGSVEAGQTSDDVPLSASSSGTFARRFSSLLGRSSPTQTSPGDPGYKGHRQRASIGGGMAHKASTKTAVAALPQVTETQPPDAASPSRPTPTLRPSGSEVPLSTPAEGQGVHRSSTVGEASPGRHQRGVSMGATPGQMMAGQSGRRPLSAVGAPTDELVIVPRSRAAGADDTIISMAAGTNLPELDAAEQLADVPSSGAEDHADEGTPVSTRAHQDVGFVGRTAQGNTDAVKPVWGLWSVNTTTTKSVATIRADLIRVLDRLGVQHRDVKSGFECAHVPSIDLSSVGGGGKDKDKQHHKGTIRRRASRILLGGKDKDAASIAAGEESSTSLHQSQHGGGAHATDRERQTTSSTSFGAVHDAPLTHSPSLGNQGGEAKFTSSTAEGSSVSSDLIVRFEIFIVRMPLLPGINGLQFRRIGGNAWQYQMLARRVLAELKL